MLLLMSCLITVCFHGQYVKSELVICPTWMYYDSKYEECLCGQGLRGIVQCEQEAKVEVTKFFCIFLSEELNTTLIGTCPYGLKGTLPKNISELNGDYKQCGIVHRKGPLCGECENNYSLPVYSYYLGCVQCKDVDYKYGWIKFIAVAFLPLTIFYIVVITFRISATSSALNGYVLMSQMLATPTLIRVEYTYNIDKHIDVPGGWFFVQLGFTIYTIWNLDFFRSFYGSICLHPKINYQQVLMMDYAVAVYPLVLILITFIFVKLHDNYSMAVWLWKPFHKCLVLFRKQWNIQSYLVNALATFIVLSYVKILNVSFEFLMFSSIYNMKGQWVSKAYWYYDGTVNMASKEYLPYLFLAIFMMLIFNILPLVLLALYPFKRFQSFLNSSCCCCVRGKLAVQIFMDAFHGCYKDNCHHFTTLYLAVRFSNLLLVSVFHYNLYHHAALVVFAITLVLVAWFQPYKCKRSNMFDVVALLLLISGYVSHNMHEDVGVMYPASANTIVISFFLLIPPAYILYLILAQLLPNAQKCFTKSKVLLLKRMNKYRAETNNEDQAFKTDGVNYNACQ